MRHGYLLAAAIWTIGIASGHVAPGVDAAQFYMHRFPNPYVVTDYASGSGFYYSPPVALLFAPLTAFGLPVFAAILTGVGLLALYGLLGRWAWLGLLFPPVWWDVSGGNVNTLIGWASVAGVGAPAAFAIPLLTKASPGLVAGWHAVRLEWRGLAIAAATPVAVALVSAVIAPSLWGTWISSLTSNGLGYAGPGYFTIAVPLVPRLITAAALLVWGGRTGRRWTLPIVATLAMPVLWYSALAPLVALGRQDVWARAQELGARRRPNPGQD